MRMLLLAAAFAGPGLLFVGVGVAQQHIHHDHGTTPTGDTRQFVQFPDELREHTLANMRDRTCWPCRRSRRPWRRSRRTRLRASLRSG